MKGKIKGGVKMDARLINSSTDLVALVPGLRKHGQYHIGPCPFCGGDDRFTIKRAEAGDLWICRKWGDGRYRDAVAFRMRAEGKTFSEVTRYEIRVLKAGSSARPLNSYLVFLISNLHPMKNGRCRVCWGW